MTLKIQVPRSKKRRIMKKKYKSGKLSFSCYVKHKDAELLQVTQGIKLHPSKTRIQLVKIEGVFSRPTESSSVTYIHSPALYPEIYDVEDDKVYQAGDIL